MQCPHCRYVTRAPYDATVIPASPFGPRLMALVALFTGVYHLSRRRAQDLLSDVLHQQERDLPNDNYEQATRQPQEVTTTGEM